MAYIHFSVIFEIKLSLHRLNLNKIQVYNQINRVEIPNLNNGAIQQSYAYYISLSDLKLSCHCTPTGCSLNNRFYWIKDKTIYQWIISFPYHLLDKRYHRITGNIVLCNIDIVAGNQDILLNSKEEFLQGAVPSTRTQRGFGR